MLYGTGELKSAGEAFAKGFGVGAVSSGLRNIEDALWPEDSRDPKRMCGSPNPFDLADGLGNGRGYHSGRGHGGAGHSRTGEGSRFSLGGLVKDMLIGGIVGGLGSAGFYGAGKAVKALREGIAGRGNGMYRKESNLGDFRELDELMQLKNVKRIANKAGIGLKGVRLKIDRNPDLFGKGVYGYTDGTTITLYPDAFTNTETLVKTLGHERMHVYQVKVFGKPTSSDVLINFEKAAYSSEKHWWDYYNLMNGGK